MKDEVDSLVVNQARGNVEHEPAGEDARGRDKVLNSLPPCVLNLDPPLPSFPSSR